MPEWKVEKERIRWLIKEGKLKDDMKVKLVIPSLDARSRMENREKRRRVVFMVDEQTFSDWAAVKDRYVRLCDDHPVIAHHIMVKILAVVPDEIISGMANDGIT